MHLVLFSGQTKHTPYFRLLAGLTKHICERAGNIARSFEHLITIIHNAHRRVLGKDYKIHSRKTDFRSLHNITYLFCIGNDFFSCVQAWHRVLEDTYTCSRNKFANEYDTIYRIPKTVDKARTKVVCPYQQCRDLMRYHRDET